MNARLSRLTPAELLFEGRRSTTGWTAEATVERYLQLHPEADPVEVFRQVEAAEAEEDTVAARLAQAADLDEDEARLAASA